MTSDDWISDEATLELVIRAANLGVWDWNLALNSFRYSPRARDIYGFSRDETVTHEMIRDATHPDDLPYTSAQARRALDPTLREDRPYEYRIYRVNDGELRWIRAEGVAVFEEMPTGARAVRYLGCIQDVTESKLALAALAESERKQHLAIEAAGMAIWEFSINENRMTISKELNRLFGFVDSEDVSIEALRECYLPGEREKTQSAALEALTRGQTHFEVEFQIRRIDGEVRWLLLRAEILMCPEGNPERLVGVVMDVDERRRNTERQNLLLRELNHRVKNSLSVVQSIANQTFKSAVGAEGALSSFQSRLRALAEANDLLVQTEWTSFNLASLLDRIVAPYRAGHADHISIEGADHQLPPRSSVPLALALHELATNAAKYGALSVPDGELEIGCVRLEDVLLIRWIERGGPVVRPGRAEGFGTRLLTRILAQEFRSIRYALLPTGVHCEIELGM